ncbi:MAG: fatty acid desaturase [Hyphomicrobiaceae bacterium]
MSDTERPPLSEVRDTLQIQWYRSRLDPAKFREFSRRSDLKGAMQAGGHLALFLMTGALVCYFWLKAIWPAFLVALFVHGTVGSFFRGTATHELGHGTVFRTDWLNKIFLYLFSLISWWNPFDYACSHTYHHRYTLHPDGDREVLLPLHPKVGKTFLLQMFTINLLTQPGRTFGKGGFISTVWITMLDALGKTGSEKVPFNEWLQALRADQPAEHRKSMWWSRLLLIFHGSIIVIAAITNLWVLPLVLTLPSYIANWLSYFVSLPQHCGLRENTTDFRKSVRSMKLNPLLEFLYWHMNWHVEHHMFAGVPCYNLRKLHLEVQDDMPEPRTLTAAWREMLDTWQRQQSEPGYQFDTPLPPTARTGRRAHRQQAENSIGNLAPKGLA